VIGFTVAVRFRDIAQDIVHVDTQSAIALGAPVGGKHATGDILMVKLVELRRLGETLKC